MTSCSELSTSGFSGGNLTEETALTQIFKERKDRLAEKVIPSSFGGKKEWGGGILGSWDWFFQLECIS